MIKIAKHSMLYIFSLFLVIGFVFSQSILENVQVNPDCDGIDDGVVICDVGNDKLVYAECYDGKALQMIGDNNTWQKTMPLWMQNLSKDEYKQYLDMGIIRYQEDCSPLTFETASYISDRNEQESDVWNMMGSRIERNREILPILFVLLLLLFAIRSYMRK